MTTFVDPPKIKTSKGISGLKNTAPGALAKPRPPLELKPPTPTKNLPKKPLNIANPKPNLPNLPKRKPRPSGGRVRGGGFAASRGTKAAGKKLGFKSVGSKVIPVLGGVSLFYDAVGLAEDLAPGVQHWLTGGWKGTTPGTTIDVYEVGQCAANYLITVDRQFANRPSSIFTSTVVSGPILGLRTNPAGSGTHSIEYQSLNGNWNVLPGGGSVSPINPIIGINGASMARVDGMPDTCGEPQPQTAPHPITETPTNQDSLPFPDSLSFPNFSSPNFPKPPTTSSPRRSPDINLTPPGDLAPSPRPTGPGQEPATPTQPAPDPSDTDPTPEDNPTGDSCSLDPCQNAIGNKLDDIGRDTDQIEKLKDQLENVLDYQQDAYRHNQVMDKLQQICNSLDKEEEEESDKPELEVVKIAYCDCSDRDPEIKFFSIQVPIDSITQENRQLFLDSAQKAFLQCSEPELFIVTPEKFKLRPTNNAQQLVITFRKRGASGKWDKDGYRITLPHYNGPKNERPRISDYTRGNILCTQYLADATQISFYCTSETEGNKVLRQLLRYIPNNLISDDKPATFVKTRRNTPREKVTFYNACFYQEGNENKKPNWKVWYEGREKVGKGQPTL